VKESSLADHRALAFLIVPISQESGAIARCSHHLGKITVRSTDLMAAGQSIADELISAARINSVTAFNAAD
jgi:hypothetical protein